ncbi:Diaminohydroxyphosphoribosylaminopyrimidine deaminase / 5-amino-6-(5-phosphoribosylamino)uracil reductase [Lachnospiraceae bacterium TWA4]|nr:Diaminohydroxyphosphoribosylaminopyrimidine deaminase / 5-amino-6-(5-phosphoribosylamino)uracil reductase [Lachnospiraceae bacterium TWA4]
MEAGVVDKIMSYIAPKIVGGALAKSPIGGEGVEELTNAWELENCTVETIGSDFLIQGYIKKDI